MTRVQSSLPLLEDALMLVKEAAAERTAPLQGD